MSRMSLFFTMCNGTNSVSGYLDYGKLGEGDNIILMVQKFNFSRGSLETEFLRTSLYNLSTAKLPSRIESEKLNVWTESFPRSYITLVHTSQKCIEAEKTKNSFTCYNEYTSYQNKQDYLIMSKKIFNFTTLDIGISNIFQMFNSGTPKELIDQLPKVHHPEFAQ